MFNLIPLPYRILILLALAAACYGAGRVQQLISDEHARDKQTINFMTEGDKYVTDYFKRTHALAADAVIASRAEQLCVGKLRRSGRPDAAPAGNTGDQGTGQAGDGEYFSSTDFAKDAKTCESNGIQLDEIQAVLKPQLVKPKSWWQFW
jgi:hypothetical protein